MPSSGVYKRFVLYKYFIIIIIYGQNCRSRCSSQQLTRKLATGISIKATDPFKRRYPSVTLLRKRHEQTVTDQVGKAINTTVKNRTTTE